MPSAIHQIKSDQWTKVTTNEQSGSYLSIGHSTIYLYQGPSAPTKAAGAAPMLDTVTSDSPTPFFDIPQGEFIWARTVTGVSYLHVTGGKTHAGS